MKLWKYDIALDPVPALIGFLQGLGFYAVSKLVPDSASLWNEGLRLFLALAPTFLILALRPSRWIQDLLVACGIGAFFAGLYVWLGSHTGHHDLSSLTLTAIGGSFVLLCFYLSGRDRHFRDIPYADLFRSSKTSLYCLGSAISFAFATFIVLFLWGALFSLIKIEFFAKTFEKPWFYLPFFGAVIGFAVPFFRTLIGEGSFYRLEHKASHVLAPVLAFAGLSFLLALPFTGLAPLWATKHATPILLGMVIAFIILVNGAIQDGSEPKPFWRPAAFLIKAFLVALPVYGLLAFYSVWLRVAQYGLTPQRVMALIFAWLAVLYGLAYVAALLFKRRSGSRNWIEGLTVVNPRLALATVVVFVLVHIPGLDATSLSARNQLSRLQNGKVAATDFDFGALKFAYGKPGLQALDKIRHDPRLSAREDIKTALADLETTGQLSDWRAAQEKVRQGLTGKKREKLLTTLDGLPIFPSNALMPQRFLPALLEMAPDLAKSCANRDPADSAPCAIILLDFNRDGYDDTAIWTGGSEITLFIWNSPKDRYEQPIRMVASAPFTLDTLRAADKAGQIRIIPARVDSLVVGTIRFD